MGNCQENSSIPGQHPHQTESNQGAYSQQQQYMLQQEHAQQANHQDMYHSSNINHDQAQFLHQPPKVQAQGPEQIDFDKIGRDFIFAQEALKIFDDSPWQRDENDGSNRPSSLSFGQNNIRQPLPNGLATSGVPNMEYSSINNQRISQSMNRQADKGYSMSILASNRKKQQIFYDASTYNQDPYVKGISHPNTASRLSQKI